MNENIKNNTVTAMKKIGQKAIGKVVLSALIAAAVVALLLFLVGDADVAFTIFGALLMAFVMIFTQMHRVSFGIEAISHASYLKKHQMEYFLIMPKEFSRSIFSYFEMGRIHFKDQAIYELNGEKHKANIYKMLMMKNQLKPLVVFRDIEKPSVVFAMPAVYVEEMARTFNN